jgi:hypothetical protein
MEDVLAGARSTWSFGHVTLDVRIEKKIESQCGNIDGITNEGYKRWQRTLAIHGLRESTKCPKNGSMTIHLVRYSGVLLAIASLSKIVSFTSTSDWLSTTFAISTSLGRVMCLLIIAAELAIGLCASYRPVATAPSLLVLSSVFFGFHVANTWLGTRPACPCFGVIDGESIVISSLFAFIIVGMMVLASCVVTLKGVEKCQSHSGQW